MACLHGLPRYAGMGQHETAAHLRASLSMSLRTTSMLLCPSRAASVAAIGAHLNSMTDLSIADLLCVIASGLNTIAHLCEG